MKLHANARLSPIGRQLLVDRIERESWTVCAAAESAGISERTARKWLARWRLDGSGGLCDRSSAPARVANRTDEQTVAAILALRRVKFTAAEIAELLARPLSTVSAVLTRPYRPQTNGKAERFIRTMLEGWAYAPIYGSTAERTAALDGWLWHYNHRRRHQALGKATPITRLNNLLRNYN
jgi:integrase-like protein/transposase IS481 family protein